jgi:hypothetical protein
MSSMRSFISFPIALLVATAAAGCGEEKPKPDPSAATTATATGSAKGRLNVRTPLAPTVKVDPQANKDYRVDVCYFGTMTLRQARDAYTASLAGAEPSEKKIPSFGGAVAPATPPATSGTAKAATPPATGAVAAPPATARPATPPATTVAPTAKPVTAGTGTAAAGTAAAPPGSAKPGGTGASPTMPEPPGRRPFDVALRAPHERNARACSVAAGLKDAPMGEVDAALTAFAPYAVELAKAIAAATTYYQREEYKKDSFAKGKELHKQLTDGFAKLDDMSAKLGDAIESWRKAHPVDPAKMEEGEKLAIAAYTDARDLMLAVNIKKSNVQGFKDASGRLEKSVEAVKTYATSHPTDPWGKMMAAPLESMLKAAKEADAKVSDKGVDGDTYLMLVNSFVGVIEQKYRALSRATTLKAAPAASGAPAAPATATAAPKPE